MLIKVIVALILTVILVLLIVFILRDKKLENISTSKSEPENSYRNCPICGIALKRGETVHSHLYPGKPDGMMHIFGCPYCYKKHPRFKELKNNRRVCPFCKKDIPKEGWVIARVFEKPEKTHIHVLGCTVCRKVN